MGPAKKAPRKRPLRKLSPDAKGVNVPMHPERLKKVDRVRARFGMSRGALVGTVFDHFVDEAVKQMEGLEQRERALAAAEAQTLEPLVEALDRASAAWQERAYQRQMIGALENQVARFANILRLRLREGESEAEEMEEELYRLTLTLQGVERRLDEQEAAELEDDQVLAEVRALIRRLGAGA